MWRGRSAGWSRTWVRGSDQGDQDLLGRIGQVEQNLGERISKLERDLGGRIGKLEKDMALLKFGYGPAALACSSRSPSFLELP